MLTSPWDLHLIERVPLLQSRLVRFKSSSEFNFGGELNFMIATSTTSTLKVILVTIEALFHDPLYLIDSP
jgi:hypothetical protein